MLAAIPQEATMSSGQDSSHLFLIVEDMGMQSKLVIQANWAMGTHEGFGRSQIHAPCQQEKLPSACSSLSPEPTTGI